MNGWAPSPTHLSEGEEWVLHRIETWVETYKKAMLAPYVLGVVAGAAPSTVAEISLRIGQETDWRLTERGLYRTLQRLVDGGMLVSVDRDAPRTGAKRKEFSLSSAGARFLAGVRTQVVELPGPAGR